MNLPLIIGLAIVLLFMAFGAMAIGYYDTDRAPLCRAGTDEEGKDCPACGVSTVRDCPSGERSGKEQV